jgi:hypothetical protein
MAFLSDLRPPVESAMAFAALHTLTVPDEALTSLLPVGLDVVADLMDTVHGRLHTELCFLATCDEIGLREIVHH